MGPTVTSSASESRSLLKRVVLPERHRPRARHRTLYDAHAAHVRAATAPRADRRQKRRHAIRHPERHLERSPLPGHVKRDRILRVASGAVGIGPSCRRRNGCRYVAPLLVVGMSVNYKRIVPVRNADRHLQRTGGTGGERSRFRRPHAMRQSNALVVTSESHVRPAFVRPLHAVRRRAARRPRAVCRDIDFKCHSAFHLCKEPLVHRERERHSVPVRQLYRCVLCRRTEDERQCDPCWQDCSVRYHLGHPI